MKIHPPLRVPVFQPDDTQIRVVRTSLLRQHDVRLAKERSPDDPDLRVTHPTMGITPLAPIPPMKIRPAVELHRPAEQLLFGMTNTEQTVKTPRGQAFLLRYQEKGLSPGSLHSIPHEYPQYTHEYPGTV